MLNDEETDQGARKVTDEIEVDAFVKPPDRMHHDRFAQHTHELPDESSEATSRALIRVVPLAYGALLGGLADHMLLGLSAGIAISVAFDVYMGNNSMVRSVSRNMMKSACPAIAKAAHGLARAIRRLGLAVPSALSKVQCDASQS